MEDITLNGLIRMKLEQHDYDVKEVYKCYDEVMELTDSTAQINTFKAKVRNFEREHRSQGGENRKLIKQTQAYKDKLRVNNAIMRNDDKVTNAIEEYIKELITALDGVNLSVKTVKGGKMKKHKRIGIIHITDTHFNELINRPENKYDFMIASKRLQKLATMAKTLFKAMGINKVLIASTGDLLNSDRRLDELLCQATNRAKASLLSVYLMEQFIIDISNDFNEVLVTGVYGNEGRMFDEFTHSEVSISNNYDYTILKILGYLFRKSKRITFFECGYNDGIVDVNGKNINNVRVDYMLFGHLHASYSSSFFARGGSLCGSNDYSSDGLHLNSKAMQNLVVVNVDLQNYDDYKGYDIISELEEYNAKSHDKLKKYNNITKI